MENVNNDFNQDYDEYSASDQLVSGERIDDINNIVFDDVEDNNEPDNSHYEDSNDYQEPAQDEPEDLITSLLKSRGISNPEAIKFVNDDGTEEVDSFYNLSLEEKLYILNYSGENEQPQTQSMPLQEDQLLKQLEENGLTVDDYVNLRLQEELAKYSVESQSYQVDALPDDELYIHNLKQIYPDLTDEDVSNSLQIEKDNPDLFAKKMSSLRQAYRAEEENEIDRIRKQEEEAILVEQQKFENEIMDASRDFKEISVIDLEKEDVDTALNVLFKQDASGMTPFVKAINDPKQLLKIAWFIDRGEEAINMIVNDFKKIIAESRKEEPQAQQEPTKKAQTYSRPASSNKKETKRKDIQLPEALRDDLYGDFYVGGMNDVNL